jgi:hypothetical protein
MLALSVAFSGVVAASQTPLVASDRVLVSFDTAILGVTVGSEARVVLQKAGDLETLAVPAQREVRCRDNLYKVHEVEVGILDILAGTVKRVLVVVGPGRSLAADLASDFVGELRTKAEGVDDVGEVVRLALGGVPVVLQIVNVHVAAAEASSRSKVEVANNLVHAQATLNAATFLTLSIQLLSIVLALTLLDALSTAKGPRRLGVGFTNFVTSLAAAGLSGIRRGLSTVAATAVGGIEVGGSIIVEGEGLGVDIGAALGLGLKTDFVDTVHDAVLLLARDIHDIEGQELAGHLGECDVEVDLHSLSCKSHPRQQLAVLKSQRGSNRGSIPGDLDVIPYLFLYPQSTRGVSRPGDTLTIHPRPGR